MFIANDGLLKNSGHCPCTEELLSTQTTVLNIAEQNDAISPPLLPSLDIPFMHRLTIHQIHPINIVPD